MGNIVLAPVLAIRSRAESTTLNASLVTAARIETVQSVDCAVEKLRGSHDFVGMIVEASALEPVFERSSRDLARHAAGLPMLLVLSRPEGRFVNIATSLRAFTAVAPVAPESIDEFVRWASASMTDTSERLAAAIDRISLGAHLTPREYELLSEIALGSCAKEMASNGGVTVTTIRTQLDSVRRKLNAPTVEQIRHELLRSVLPPRQARGRA